MAYSAYQSIDPADCTRPTLDTCLRGHRQGVLSVALLPQSSPYADRSYSVPRILSGGADGAVILWDPKATTRSLRFVGHRGPVLAVGCSPRGGLIASCGHDGYLRLCTPNMRRSTTSLYGASVERPDERNACCWRVHSGAARALAFADDGSGLLYTAGDDKTVKSWDLNYASSSHSTGSGLGKRFVGSFAAAASAGRHAAGHMNWIRALAVQSATTSASFFHYIASGGDDQAICLWDTRSRSPVHMIFDCTGAIHSLSFHPSGFILASGDVSGAVNVFDLRHTTDSASWHGASHSLLQHYGAAHDGSAISAVDFSPNGGWLLSAGDDGVARLWDTTEGYLYCSMQGHEGSVKAAKFSEDGRYFTTCGGKDKMLLLWRSGLAAHCGTSAKGTTLLPIGSPTRPIADEVSKQRPVVRRPPLSAPIQRQSSAVLSHSGGAKTPPVDCQTPLSSSRKIHTSGTTTPLATSASRMGLPPLSPSSPPSQTITSRSTDLDSRDGPRVVPWRKAALSPERGQGTEAPMSHGGAADGQRERSFERSEARYSHLTVPSSGSSAAPEQSHQQQPVRSAAAVSMLAVEELEQEKLLWQERAYQQLQDERIASKRLVNLEEAVASLASYLHQQGKEHEKEMATLRIAAQKREDKNAADLAELKQMLAQLTEARKESSPA